MDITTRVEAKKNGAIRYFTGRVCPSGHISERYSSTRACVACCHEKAEKLRIEHPETFQKYTAAWRSRNVDVRILSNAKSRTMLQDAKKGSRHKGLGCDLILEDIIVPDNCPCCGVKICCGKGQRTLGSPSLDRIDNTRGYTKDNVAVICWGCNRRKMDSTLEQLENLVKYMKSKGKSNA